MSSDEGIILLAIDDFQTGGVLAFVKQYVYFLKKNNKKVLILGRKGDANIYDYFDKDDVWVINSKVRYGLINRIINFFRYYVNLVLIFNKFNVTTIHLGTTWSAFYCLLFWKTWTIKRIITFYGAYDLEIKSYSRLHSEVSKLTSLKNKIRWTIQLFTLKFSQDILTFSQYAKDLIIAHFGTTLEKKIIVVPGAVKVRKPITSFSKNTKNKKNEFVILNFGRAEPRKGLDLLLEAAREMIDAGHKVKVILASPVQYFEWSGYLQVYERLNLFDRIQFIHVIDEKQKEHLIKSADVFVMPSIEFETFGMTVVESLSRGLLVIGTPVGAIPEILSEIEPRLIAKDTSGKALYESLVWFKNLKNSEKLKLQERAYKVIREKFSHKSLQQGLSHLYKVE